MAAITVAMRTEISQLYVSLFGRAPDSEGLGFWVNSLANGTTTLSKIAQSMYETSPARAYYPLFATPSEVVTTFYTNVLGRAPDAEGLAFWVAEYNSAKTQGDFFSKLVSNVVNYTGTDEAGLASKALFTNKVAVAQYFGEQGGTIAGATAALSGVTADASTVDAAKAAILNPVVAAQTFALTTSTDDKTLGAGNDTFTGVYGGSDTLNTGDNLFGGAGADTLSVLVATAGGVMPIVSLSSIETVDLRLLGSTTFNQIQASGVSTISISANSVDDTALTVTNADITTTFKVQGETDLIVDYVAGASGVAKISLSTAGSSGNASIINVGTADAVSSVDISTLGSSHATLSVTGGLAVAVSGAGALTMTVDAGVSALNAANLTGSGSFTFATGAAVTVTGGSNNDTIDFGAAGGLTAADTVNGGDGADTVVAAVNGAFLSTKASSFNSVETLAVSAAAGSTNTLDASGGTISSYVLRGTGAFSLRNMASATVTLSDDDLTSVSADMANAALSIVGGSASAGSMDFGSLTISDATTVNVTAFGTGAASMDFGAVTLDDSTRTVTVNTQGNGSINFDGLSASAATSVTITTSQSASYTGTASLAQASSLAALTLSAGSEGADLVFGDTSRVGGSNAVSAQGFTLSLSGSNGGDLTFGGLTLAASVAAGAFTVNAGSGSTITMGTSINGGNGASIASLSASGGQDSVLTLGGIEISGTSIIGAISVNMGGSAAFTIGTAAAGSISDISVSAGARSTYAQGTLTGSSIGNISIVAPTTTLGAISATGSVGNITYNGSSLSAADISASAIGNLDISAAGTAALVGLESDGDQTNIGDITFNGGILTITNIGTGSNGGATGSVGSITVSASNLVDINAIDAGSIGAITVRGSGSFELGGVDSDSFVSFDASGVVGSASTTVSANFAAVTSNISITLGGSSTNTVVSGLGDDEIILNSVSADDTIVYNLDTQGTDYIRGFDLGTGDDVLKILAATASSNGIKIMHFGGLGTANQGAGTAVAAYNATSIASSHLQFTAGAMTTAAIGTADYVVISGTSFADANSMITSLATGGFLALTYGATGSPADHTGGQLLVVWTDGTNGHATLVDITLAATGSMVDLSATGTFVTLADIDGLTQAKLVNWASTNIDFDAA